jgi:maltose alpha-D-glucosyltransferase/alpha-amylase
MQWSPDRNAGFSTASRQRLYEPVVVDYEYHYEAVNVQAQQSNPYSLLWWTKRLIALRKRYQAFSRGTLEMLHPENRKILAFTRRYGDEVILVVANLSRYVQFVELDLGRYQGMTPVELFGRASFPPVRDQPYPLTLGPHAFYWFSIEPVQSRIELASGRAGPAETPMLTVAGSWTELLHERGREALERALPAYLRGRRWFAGKARQMRSVRLQDAVPLQGGSAYIALVQVDYTEGDPDRYVVPLACAGGEDAARIERKLPHAIVARVRANGHDAPGSVVYDGLADHTVGTALLEAIAGRRRLRGAAGELIGAPTAAFRRARDGRALPEPAGLRGEQSNTSLVYGDQWILKLFRRVEAGVNPEQEMLAFLNERGFRHAPALAGALEYQWDRGARGTAAVVEELVPSEGDAWQFTLDDLRNYTHSALGVEAEVPTVDLSARALLDQSEVEPPPMAYETIGAYLDHAHLLGQRTAELHLALASEPSPPEFAPEPFTSFYQRSLYQSARSQLTQVFQLLRRRVGDLPDPVQAAARDVLAFQDTLHGRFRAVMERKIAALRIRCHGDYHLGQVLYTGKDFVIIDFEGEPSRPLSERRLKRSALSDVAGMLRSYHYATRVGLRDQAASGLVRDVDVARLEPWIRFWHFWVSASFLRAYRRTAAGASFLPATREDVLLLLEVHLLDKAVYELGYELNNRPDWLSVPIQGLLELLRV